MRYSNQMKKQKKVNMFPMPTKKEVESLTEKDCEGWIDRINSIKYYHMTAEIDHNYLNNIISLLNKRLGRIISDECSN